MKWLWENFWLKVVAFILGLLVWFHVATEKTYNYDLKLPVSEITLQEGLALSKEPPDSIGVAVSATGKKLLRREWRKRGLRINASQFKAGRYSLTLTPANTSLVHPAADVSLDEVLSPSSIQLQIDMASSAEVPVMPDLETVPDEGFAIDQDIEVTPPKVTLFGPRSQIGLVSAIYTDHRKLTGLRNNVTVALPLVCPPIYGFSLEPESVTVTVTVVPVKTALFEDIPVMIFNAPSNVSVTTDPARVAVKITGPPQDIDQLSRNAITASVDYNKTGPDGMAAVKVDCPPVFRVKSVSADSVKMLTEPHADSRN